MSLETVDLADVEILAADVTIHGIGSPSKGDRYSTADLRAIAQANRELAAELRPPAKIGHEPGGPAVGQLENIRVSGSKLLADVKRVPKRFSELVNSGAYDSRSVELSRVTSQRTGRRYDFVVTALAWLGDKLLAVRRSTTFMRSKRGTPSSSVRTSSRCPRAARRSSRKRSTWGP